MVCAAAALTVSANHIEKVRQIKILPVWLNLAPSLPDVVQLIEDTANQLSFEGTIVAEKGICTINPCGCRKVCLPGLSNIRNPLPREGR